MGAYVCSYSRASSSRSQSCVRGGRAARCASRRANADARAVRSYSAWLPLILTMPCAVTTTTAGYVPAGDKYAGAPTIKLLVRSDLVRPAWPQLHTPSSAGTATGRVRSQPTHCRPSMQHTDEEYGGPFWIDVSPKMKISDLRIVIRVSPMHCRGTPRLVDHTAQGAHPFDSF